MKIEDLKIFCKNTQEYIDLEGGDTLLEVVQPIVPRLGFKPIGALVNNKTEALNYPVYGPKMVEFIDVRHPAGFRIYIYSLCMIMSRAVAELHPDKRLIFEHSISNGYYCKFKHDESPIPAADVVAIKARMKEIVAADIRFARRERLTADVIEIFKQRNSPDKVRLLSTSKELYTVFYKLGDYCDIYYGPLAPSTGYISVFDLVPYNSGMLLLPPDRMNPETTKRPIKQKKMFQAFTDHINFNRIIRVGDVGVLNKVVTDKMATMLINVAEALHSKMFDRIATDIASRYRHGGARVVLIAGPSSSGKTTSSKRLAIQLLTNYITPRVVELDNYFVNRENTPRDETGDYDYESLYALDLEQFNADLTDLIAGREVKMPTYNFERGCREYKGNTLRLREGDVLLIEGIHGLNPELTKTIPEEQKFRLYVSALTTLSIDDHNWISTSDNRLLRRIVRDHKYRGSDARNTIARWSSVRRGEEKWIFPFQENADATFNSSLLFELAVMRNYAIPILRQVPRSAPEYAEAYRLLKFLNFFEPLDEQDVPHTSLLREFLGGSSFKY